MTPIPFLADLVVILAAAVGVTLVSHRLRLPAVVGFLLTGILIGPSGLALVSDRDTVQRFAEVGIVFLLFAIGLEFSLDRLREIRRPFFVGGALQAGLTIAAAAGLGAALGRAPGAAVFYGFLLALSSTAIVLKLLAERDQLEAPQGKAALGILLFQDFLIVPLILVTPLLAGRAAASPSGIALRLAVGVAVVAVVFGAARYLMPRLLASLVRTGVREVLVLGALLACLGMALLTESAGFSLALGAFLAGIVIAESDYSHQVLAEVLPFRDVFNSLFFIAVGMLLRLDFAVAHWPEVAALFAGVVVVKALLAFPAALAIGLPVRVATIVALSLAQVGEFSFVLARVGEANGLLDAVATQYFLAASVLSLLATPALFALAPRLGALLQRGRAEAARPSPPAAPLTDHVVIVGFGVNGRNLARVLRAARIRYVVVELAGETARAAKRQGQPVVYGDATRPAVLAAAGVERARVVVLGISDHAAARQAIRLAREMNPALHVIVRTRRVAEIDPLHAAGAAEVVAEEFESSIEIFNRVLRHYHVPRNVVAAQERLLRGEKYEALRAPTPGVSPERVMRLLAAGTTDVYQVEPGGAADGRTIAEVNLRRRTGASIIAVVRGDTSHPNPPADLLLQPGDALVLVGSHAEIERAFAALGG